MINAAHQLKCNKYLWGLVTVSIITLIYIAGDNYYKNYIQYRELERTLLQIHEEMSRDIPKESWTQMDHFGVGAGIRNYYHLWNEKSELSQLFKKNGVLHPDDMSALIMETFLRAQKGVPFRLHRLIELQTAVYKAKDGQALRAHMRKMADEFLILEEYKEYLDRTPIRPTTVERKND